jgi:SAM-dependent methyltransferase
MQALLAAGKTQREVAELLGVSANTVGRTLKIVATDVLPFRVHGMLESRHTSKPRRAFIVAMPPIPRASASAESAPTMMSGAEKYRLNRYQHFDQAWVNRREQRLIAQLLEAWHVPGGTLLDIPCGYGRLVPVYSCFGITATGVDVHHDTVQLMLAHHMPLESKRGVCASVFDLPFADNTFDIVLCVRFLHRRYTDVQRKRILGELARVSRHRLIISYYRFTPLHALSRHWRGTRGRLAPMSGAQWLALIQGCGLQVLDVQSLLPYVHMQTFVVLNKYEA